jgi:hypothetical protein
MTKTLEDLKLEAHDRVALRLAGCSSWSARAARARRSRRRLQDALFSLLTLGGAIAAAGAIAFATGVV